ncbi:hypothetical protein GH5_02253 [Leishmania sp. Ghana 2012 LV757]|uniref:hypothetical protein n=1 Tax=Leishmania sp. Ghana 2012 LV757 TaxID=2803181 RepID=UPI001B485B44|nr:hypothetical protein GH5_02253 [Leishmania sp. Ghana 2012 LV757]
MSLFDVDNSRSTSEELSSTSDEGTLPTCPPPPPLLTAPSDTRTSVSRSSAYADGIAPLSALEQRRRMAELDAARWRNGGARWRSELLGPPSAALNTLSAAASSVQPERASSTFADGGKFGNSITAALNLRREEKEKALLKRVVQQRKADEESIGVEVLAEKDADVGVFVTASYKELLQRNLHLTEKSIGGLGAQCHTKADGDDDGGSNGNNDGPLGAYLRQLEGTSHPDTDANDASPSASRWASGDYYGRVMKAPLLEEEKTSSTAAATAAAGAAASPGEAGDFVEASPVVVGSAERSGLTSLVAPTLGELQELVDHTAVGLSATPKSMKLPHADTGQTKGTAKPAVAGAAEGKAVDAPSPILAHARLLFDTRQAKSCRGANDATVVAAAHRCDERIGASLFASLS